VIVSKGYPGDYEKGKEISIGSENKDSNIFHAGTVMKEGKIFTNGGRVITVTSFGENIMEARNNSYRQIENINFEGMYFRKDIGKDLISD
jgi:phosphoribosylamine--glycine ligase